MPDKVRPLTDAETRPKGMGFSIMTRYKNDPYPLKVKFNSTCATCGCKLPKGVNAYYWPSSRKVYCLACGEKDYCSFLESAVDEELFNNQYGRY